MNYQFTNLGAELQVGTALDLKNTFDCGQCFRWDEQSDGSFVGIVGHHQNRIYRKDKETVIIEGCSAEEFETLWKDYLDWDTDYNAIRQKMRTLSDAMNQAVNSMDGIRILRQDPWEALCSFIISQNNNIPRIKGIVSRLCKTYGEPCGTGYTFPTAETLAQCSVDDLAPLRAGFRARYIIDAAQKVSGGQVQLSQMHTAPLDDCRKELMNITGVGVKVAECTLLYGLHRLEAFPIDIWMKKALSTLFKELNINELDDYAGIAQQYIFHYSRLHPELVESTESV